MLETFINCIPTICFFPTDSDHVLYLLTNNTSTASPTSPKHLRHRFPPNMYKDVPEKVLEKIRKIYWLDFQLFGYDPYRVRGKS